MRRSTCRSAQSPFFQARTGVAKSAAYNVVGIAIAKLRKTAPLSETGRLRWDMHSSDLCDDPTRVDDHLSRAIKSPRRGPGSPSARVDMREGNELMSSSGAAHPGSPGPRQNG